MKQGTEDRQVCIYIQTYTYTHGSFTLFSISCSEKMQ